MILFNDQDSNILADIKFADPILGVKANTDLIVVVFENQTVVFNTQDFKFRDNIPTCPNEHGLSCLYSKTVISFEKDSGKLRIKSYEEEKEVVYTLDSGEKSV